MTKTAPLLIALITAAAASSCKRSTTPAIQQTPAQNTNAVAADQKANPQGGATAAMQVKYLKGSIGNALGLQMKLVREGDKLSGSYAYQNIGARIQLKGSIDKDNNLVLEEFDPSGKQTGVFKGLWTVSSEDGMTNLVGNWTKPDGQKKTAFSVHEEPIEFGGEVELTTKSIKDNNKKLKYEIEVEYPQLAGLLTPGFQKFNQEASRLALREVGEFKKNMAESADETETPEQSSAAASSFNMSYTVAWATKDLISVEFDVGTYYHGAAHPNSNSDVLNFDVKNGKQLKLSNLFKPGAKYLQAISKYSIKDLKKQSKAKGSDGMLEDESLESGAAPTPKNYQSWTITRKGLGITFDAYQVGPYAAGPQYVMIPYSALKDIIEPNGPLAQFVK